MKKLLKILLWGGCILIALPVLGYLVFIVGYGLHCALPIKEKYVTLDAGGGRKIEILADMIDIDYCKLYIRAADNKKSVMPLTPFGGLGNVPRKFALIGANHPVVGVFENEAFMDDRNILAMVDFSTGEYWVSTATSQLSRAAGCTLLSRLRQETDRSDVVLGKNANW